MDSNTFSPDVVLYGVLVVGALYLLPVIAIATAGVLFVRRGARVGGALVIASVVLGLFDRFGGFVLSRVLSGTSALSGMSYLTIGARFISECTLAVGLLLIVRALK